MTNYSSFTSRKNYEISPLQVKITFLKALKHLHMLAFEEND